MKTEKLQEVLNAVHNINESLYEILGDNTTDLVYVIIEPYNEVIQIKLWDTTLWYSDEDDREWMDTGDYEPVEPFLRRKINNMIKYVAEIKL